MAPNEAGNLRKFGEMTLVALKNSMVLPRTILTNTSATDARVSMGATGTGGTVDFLTDLIVPNDAKVHGKADRASGAEFVYENVSQAVKSVTLSDYIYSAYSVNYNEETFLTTATNQNLVTSASNNVARKINALVLDKMNAVKATGTAISLSGSVEEKAQQIFAQIIKLRTLFNTRGVDAYSRFLAVDPEIAGILLASSMFRDASQAGSVDALVNASFGRQVAGFTIVEDAGLTAGTMVAYDSSAFVLVMRPAAPSEGATKDILVTRDDLTLNVTVDRDGRGHRDLVTVGSFVAVDSVDELKSAAVKFTAASLTA